MSGTRGKAPAHLRETGAALSLVIWLGIAGCGQSGDLVLPEPAAPPAGGAGNGAASNDTQDSDSDDAEDE